MGPKAFKRFTATSGELLFKDYMFLVLSQVRSNTCSVKHVINVVNMLSCCYRPLFYSKNQNNVLVVHLLHAAVPVTG